MASETGSAKTTSVPSCQALRMRGCEPAGAGLTPRHMAHMGTTKCLERHTRAGESPVVVLMCAMLPKLEYRATREIAWEAGSTTAQGYLLVVTDSAQYREGTVKSTPARGVK